MLRYLVFSDGVFFHIDYPYCTSLDAISSQIHVDWDYLHENDLFRIDEILFSATISP